MKKHILITGLLALCLLTGCGKADELQTQLDELQAQLAETEQRLSQTEREARDASSQLTEAQAQLAAAQEKLEQLGGVAALTDSRLTYADIRYDAVVIPGETKVYPLPTALSPAARALEVTIYAPVLAQGRLESDESSGEDWVLVSLPVWGEPAASLGWVPLSAVERYTRANRQDIAWPLSLEEDTPVYEDKECQAPEQTLSGGEYLLEGVLPGGEVAQITAADGWTAFVSVDALIYPELKR